MSIEDIDNIVRSSASNLLQSSDHTSTMRIERTPVHAMAGLSSTICVPFSGALCIIRGATFEDWRIPLAATTSNRQLEMRIPFYGVLSFSAVLVFTNIIQYSTNLHFFFTIFIYLIVSKGFNKKYEMQIEPSIAYLFLNCSYVTLPVALIFLLHVW